MEDLKKTERILATKEKHKEYQEMLLKMKRAFANKASALEKYLRNRKPCGKQRKLYQANAENFRSTADLLEKIVAQHQSFLEACQQREPAHNPQRILKDLAENIRLLLKKKELLEILHKNVSRQISNLLEDSRSLPTIFL
ncbi:MAG TPA: hypothetical protein PKA31_01520 [Candidatus Moranbacteria bacterium]|nr:hypothetical protein [Candidatus Moranbacteria bacterium]